MGPSSEKDKERDREIAFETCYVHGMLDDHEVEVDVPEPGGDKNIIMDNNNPNIVAMSDFLNRMTTGGPKKQPWNERSCQSVKPRMSSWKLSSNVSWTM